MAVGRGEWFPLRSGRCRWSVEYFATTVSHIDGWADGEFLYLGKFVIPIPVGRWGVFGAKLACCF